MTDKHINPTEAEERAHLANVRTLLRIALDSSGGSVTTRYTDVIQMKRYLQENKADMDHIEKAGVRESIDQMTRIGEHNLAQAGRLGKLYQTPYFGRIDFRRQQEASIAPVYIGIHAFQDDIEDDYLVHDWRAPIASMFYDFELGDAWFDAPIGRIEGRLLLKRQYRIKDGELVFMLETSLNIHDEVLQHELSRASDDRMRNIVATIQRDQNAIIRNERTKALIIQGAAGSGKTSIALHRIAYLLYKFKDTITSNDILIISPNKVFASYIAQVLPELGEEMIQETTMETLAAHLLDDKIKFQTFAEQVSLLLDGEDAGYAERIRYKSTPDFLERLEQYAVHVRNTNLESVDLDGDGYFVPAGRIERWFNQCGPMPYAAQVNFVHDAVLNWIKLEFGTVIKGPARTQLRSQLKAMIRDHSIKNLYQAFYTWLGVPEHFQMARKSVHEYADVFPLVYLSMLLQGEKPHQAIKHLVIDEMQDYTPVQYQVISRLFPCRKTILGDYHQSVNPFGASSAESIRRILPQAECMVMNKSYRSTLEITALAQRINRNEFLEPIERHGDEPDIVACTSVKGETEQIRRRINRFLDTAHYTTLGIICKTQRQADALHRRLGDLAARTQLLNAASTAFHGGIIIATAHLAKGLEFDQVIIPSCDAENYCRRIDRHMLYVAATRAMHKLTLTHTGTLTPFLATRT